MKNGKLATDYVVIGIIIVVVIFIITLTVLNLTDVSFGELEAISDDVFVDPSIAQDAINDASVRAMTNLVDNLDDYCIGERDGCSCYTGQLGTIEEGALVIVDNKDLKNTITIINNNGAYLDEFTNNYEFGLFYIQQNGPLEYSLSCVFPDKFYIIGADDEDNYQNYWYVLLKEDFADRAFIELPDVAIDTSELSIEYSSASFDLSGSDYKFGFYSEGENQAFVSRDYEDMLGDQLFPFYKIDDQHVCILTDMIELEIESVSPYEPYYLTSLDHVATGFSAGKPSEEILDEFFDYTNLCHKDSTEASEEEIEDRSIDEPVDFAEG